jgi:IS1 family transposase
MKVYKERASMRGVARCLGVHRHTLAAWLIEWISQLPALRTSVAPAQPEDVLELDELWSFVGRRAQKRWLWIALCRRTRQVVAFVIGDRSAQTCRKLWQRIPHTYRHCHTFSDFWHTYRQVIDSGKHCSVGKESGQTNHVERWNNTLRQRIGRYVRKTLSFSKTDKFHHLITKWYIYDYNLSLTP